MNSLARRTLLKGAATLLPFSVLRADEGDEHHLSSIGVQLYTVRDVLPGNPAGTLRMINSIGYKEAEVIYASLDQIWPSLKQTSLKPVSAHVDTAIFLDSAGGQLDKALETVKGRGIDYVVFPYLPPDKRGGADVYKNLADILNRAGEKCKSSGLHLCYHNHAFEFQPMGGTTPLDILLTSTQKGIVGLEMDMFWVSVAGHDPVAMLKQHGDRIPLVHLKDKAKDVAVQYNESVPKSAFKEVGQGSLDVPAVLRTAREVGVKHYFVEQDQTPGDPMASLKQSYEYLHSLSF